MAPKDSPESKNIIVTGGARGIGRGLVRYFLDAGHRVYILDILEDEMKHVLTSHLAGSHKEGKLDGSICNLREIKEVRSKVSEAAKFFDNRIDVLVNNASIAGPHFSDGKTMEDPSTYEEFKSYIDTNLTSAFAVSQAVIPFMKSTKSDIDSGAQNIDGSGPSIIHIGSFRAHQSDGNQEGYAASKAGQLGLMQSMAISLGPMGIRCNLVAPGRIKVGHESKEGDEKGTDFKGQVGEKDVDDHPVNRAGRPKDIADACLYLMNAGFVTGVSNEDSFLDVRALTSCAARDRCRWRSFTQKELMISNERDDWKSDGSGSLRTKKDWETEQGVLKPINNILSTSSCGHIT
jgi:NAD(P)-dependent dehydrogenase (short-subunit alcohol dehydrogenase family)